MGYMLPLRFINVSNKPKVAICATRIVAMMSTEIYQARRVIHDEKQAGSLINACGKNAAKTAVLLDNGVVVASPLSITVLETAIEKSNSKAASRNDKRMKVYDVADEEPNPNIDEEIDEVSAEFEEEFEDYDEDDEFDE